jgi:hypothetical protein
MKAASLVPGPFKLPGTNGALPAASPNVGVSGDYPPTASPNVGVSDDAPPTASPNVGVSGMLLPLQAPVTRPQAFCVFSECSVNLCEFNGSISHRKNGHPEAEQKRRVVKIVTPASDMFLPVIWADQCPVSHQPVKQHLCE